LGASLLIVLILVQLHNYSSLKEIIDANQNYEYKCNEETGVYDKNSGDGVGGGINGNSVGKDEIFSSQIKSVKTTEANTMTMMEITKNNDRAVDPAAASREDQKQNNLYQKQRIVILAGLHKTATTTIQTFVTNLACEYIFSSSDEFKNYERRNITDLEIIKKELVKTRRSSRFCRMHPYNNQWVWPISGNDDALKQITNTTTRKESSPKKYYAALASYVTKRKVDMWIPILLQKNPNKNRIISNNLRIFSVRCFVKYGMTERVFLLVPKRWMDWS